MCTHTGALRPQCRPTRYRSWAWAKCLVSKAFGRHHEPLCIQIRIGRVRGLTQIDAVENLERGKQPVLQPREDDNSSESFLDRICSGSKTLFRPHPAANLPMIRALTQSPTTCQSKGPDLGEGSERRWRRPGRLFSKNGKSAARQPHCEDFSRRNAFLFTRRP